ncbi:hypothetical protein L7F22_008862 [Adiantum nelumboides]|nr:hypothetical protein [Adiantum nelumboides]
MDADIVLQFQAISEPDAIRFLHDVAQVGKLQDVNDSSDSRHVLPPTHHQIMTNDGQFWLPEEISNGVDDNVNAANSDGGMEKLVQVRYRECMKNHAAALGGHSVDGCGEFFPSGSMGLDAFKCAACSCHRNFHRKEVEGSGQGCIMCGKDPKRPPTPAQTVIAPTSTCGGSILPLHHSQSDEPQGHTSHKKKRHRTIFTLEQKEKMFYFAESLGWKILKHDEECVQSFCDDVGVRRRSFRVWMHNHKHTMKRK